MEALIKILLLSLLFLIPFLIIRRLNLKRSQRRNELAKQRLTTEQRDELIEDFPMFKRLPVELQQDLEGLIHVFNAEKSYVACGGLEEVTLHMRHVIAAQACLLLLRRPHDLYAKLRTISVYPDAYVALDEHGIESVRLGESWTTGSIVLSWANVVAGGRNEEDGHNVTVHEFAHQLDQADGAGDGVPPLEDGSKYRNWSNTMKPAFEKLIERTNKNKRTVMDDYGAENPAEFFAVATETFYEKPKQLNEKKPELYALLREYYGVDPIEWL